jgi:hypothetical protein
MLWQAIWQNTQPMPGRKRGSAPGLLALRVNLESPMNRCFRLLCTLFFLCFGGAPMAQTYDFRQGYIFEQAYVSRIPLAKAEHITGLPGLFAPFRAGDWGKELIQDPRVKRTGNRLIVQFSGKAPLSLKDFTIGSTRQREGDSQKFRYLKTVANYHVLGVLFGHDQPGFLLVSVSGRDIFFVDTH